MNLFKYMNICYWHVYLGVINDDFSRYKGNSKEYLQIKANHVSLTKLLSSLSLHFLICKFRKIIRSLSHRTIVEDKLDKR